MFNVVSGINVEDATIICLMLLRAIFKIEVNVRVREIVLGNLNTVYTLNFSFQLYESKE